MLEAIVAAILIESAKAVHTCRHKLATHARDLAAQWWNGMVQLGELDPYYWDRIP